jgi:secreted trypsin-like serine protease
MTLRCLLMGIAVLVGCADVESAELGGTRDAIVNGHAAGVSEQWGTVGMIIGDAEDEWLCTGTLIAPNVIVTAAHCVIVPDTGERAERIRVVAGASDIDAPEDAQKYTVSRVLAHPMAFQGPGSDDPTGLGADYDIALVQTSEPITQVDVIPVLPMERVAQVLNADAELTIAGYGRRVVNEYGLSSEDGLHYVGTTGFVRRSEREFLAGGEGESDACPGDSGGPVYAELDGKVWLVGATSRGRNDFPTWDCGPGGIYTLIPAYAGWIEEHAADPELSRDAFRPLPVVDEDTQAAQRSAATGGCTVRPGVPRLSGASVLVLSFALLLHGRRQRITGRAACPETH